jgi:hypothetical protein
MTTKKPVGWEKESQGHRDAYYKGRQDTQNLKSALAGFTGTEKYHKVTFLPGVVATDGVAYLLKEAKAYWLIDAIASYQMYPKVRNLAIQFWTLNVKDNKATLTCVADKGKPEVIKQEIEYTDFPLDKQEIWVQNGVAMLPSEY